MIEKIVLEYLKNVLDVPVDLIVPQPEPEEYVLLEKTGSSEEDFIQSAVFAVKSHAERPYNAAVLNEKVKKEMQKMTILNEVSSVKLNTDYNFTDTAKKRYRYQAVFEIFY